MRSNGAADNGHLEVVAALIAAGANIHADTKNGWTALMHAATYGHLEMVVQPLRRHRVKPASAASAAAVERPFWGCRWACKIIFLSYKHQNGGGCRRRRMVVLYLHFGGGRQTKVQRKLRRATLLPLRVLAGVVPNAADASWVHLPPLPPTHHQHHV